MKSGRVFCILESWNVVKYMYYSRGKVLNKVGYDIKIKTFMEVTA